MENEYREYATFHITAKDGSDVEMAVVDEFDRVIGLERLKAIHINDSSNFDMVMLQVL